MDLVGWSSSRNGEWEIVGFGFGFWKEWSFASTSITHYIASFPRDRSHKL